jgi:hypothetical protein
MREARPQTGAPIHGPQSTLTRIWSEAGSIKLTSMRK